MNKLLSAPLAALSILGLTSGLALAAGLNSTSDLSFNRDVLAANQPVVVDFYADWCGPCRQMMPIVDSLSAAYAGQVKFLRVNIDQSPQTASRYGVSQIPTFAVFKSGHLTGEFTGAVSANQFAAEIEQALNRRVASR